MLHIVYAHNNINIVNEPECLNNNYYYDDEFNTAYIIIYCTRYNIIRVSSMKKISLKKPRGRYGFCIRRLQAFSTVCSDS